MRIRDFDKLLGLGLALPFVAVGLAGCGSSDEGAGAPGKPDETGAPEDKLLNGKADAWNTRNNPDGLRVEMKKKLTELHGAGLNERLEAEPDNASWPDTYWPTYRDSVNSRWQTTGDFARDLSPIEKYDAAFNGWDPSSVSGLRPFDAGNCDPSSWDDGYYDKIGPAAKYVSDHKGNADTREAAKAGKLEFNSCRARSDSECMQGCEDADNQTYCEKQCHRGGVETWWGLCHAWAPAAILEKEPLHAVTYNGVTFDIADMKALYSVIYDRSSSALIGGRCNDFEVDRDETTGRITNDGCRDLNAGSFHVSMVNLIGLQRRGFVEDRTYDFEVWNQPVKGYKIHSMDEISVEAAHEKLNVDPANPTDCVADADPAAGEYCYNKDADTLYKVEATLHWITESHAENFPTGADNLDRYSRTDRYTYILEVKDGEVVGGEWFGASITNHPDFIWLPFRARGGNPHVSIEKVRMLGRLSQTAPDAGGDAPTEDVISGASADTPIAIPDNTPAGINSVITIGDGAEVTSAKVDVDVTHTYIGDLVITLTSPSGQSFKLHNKEGGSQDDLKKTYTVEDIQGAINGAWTLNVADTYKRDTGSLNAWKMDFVVGGGEAPNATTDTFSGAGGDVPDNNATGVRFDLDVPHTYISDLEITLSKDGVSKAVHNREGGSDDNINRTYNLDEFSGQEMSGRWTLHVKDLAQLDVGKVKAWSLKITH